MITSKMERKYALAMMNFVCNSFTNVDGCSVVITMTNSVYDSFTLNHKKHGWNPSKWFGTRPQTQNDDPLCVTVSGQDHEIYGWISSSYGWTVGPEMLNSVRDRLETYGWNPPLAIRNSVHEPFIESQESWMKYCKMNWNMSGTQNDEWDHEIYVI